MRLAFVVPRYGVEVNGGAERLCREVAERLAAHFEVEVITTCARDYVTWRDEYAPGRHVINDVPVHRFPVDMPRDIAGFDRLSARLYGGRRSLADEIGWMEAQGPVSSRLLDFVRAHTSKYDYFVYVPYLYATTFQGMRLTPGQSVLIPAAHDEPPIYFSLFSDVFASAQALVFSTPEEQAFVNARFATAGVLQDVIGVGLDSAAAAKPALFYERHADVLDGRPFILYAGRIDPSKGCDHLFEYFQRYRREHREHPLKLVLLGTPVMEIPQSPDIVPLGFVSDEEKRDAMAAARLLVVPSPYESLSIVALESWQVGRPVLANGVSEVLRGHCVRSNGGLWYGSYAEFREALWILLTRPGVADALGRSGQAYVAEHYQWSLAVDKYRALFAHLAA